MPTPFPKKNLFILLFSIIVSTAVSIECGYPERIYTNDDFNTTCTVIYGDIHFDGTTNTSNLINVRNITGSIRVNIFKKLILDHWIG